MARPPKEGMDYFPHDTDASDDEKIEALRALYGNDGYAFYFILLERIYRTGNFEIEVSDAEIIQILARKVEVTVEKFNQMLSTALKWGCFDRVAYKERGILTSNGIKKRAVVVVEKREEMRKRYAEKKLISDAETREETTPETPQRKVKKSKVKESTCTPPIVLPAHEQKEDGDDNSNDLKNIIKAFETDIHLLPTATERECLIAWLDDGLEPDLIVWAIKQAALQSKRSMSYINAILQNAHTAGVTTLGQALERERDRKAKQSQPLNSQAREPTPPPPLDPEAKKRILRLNKEIAELAAKRDINNKLEGALP